LLRYNFLAIHPHGESGILRDEKLRQILFRTLERLRPAAVCDGNFAAVSEFFKFSPLQGAMVDLRDAFLRDFD
jgi:hypothetical protein